MVAAQYRLVTEGLKLQHLRLVLGFSMGGMHSWIWGEKYPRFMDMLVPMASQPTEMASRNWMMRRLVIDSIRNDPEWKNGNYTVQPASARFATVFYLIGTNGGTLKLQKLAPTHEAAEKLLDSRLNAPFATNANDLLYQYEASRDYNPGPNLERIEAKVLAINSADDERNPPETGITERALRRIDRTRLYLIPASEETTGHVTVLNAKLWSEQVRELLHPSAPRRRFHHQKRIACANSGPIFRSQPIARAHGRAPASHVEVRNGGRNKVAKTGGELAPQAHRTTQPPFD